MTTHEKIKYAIMRQAEKSFTYMAIFSFANIICYAAKNDHKNAKLQYEVLMDRTKEYIDKKYLMTCILCNKKFYPSMIMRNYLTCEKCVDKWQERQEDK